MLFNQASYKVFKCLKKTEEQYPKEVYFFDDYGSTTSYQEWHWRPFDSEYYYLEKPYNHQQTLYSNFVNVYYPIAPSGNYNQRFGELYQKTLRNMEFVGTYDGKQFDCDVPIMFTSVHELKPLDVFEFEKDHTYRDGVFKTDPVIVIPAHTSLVLERFDDISYMISEWLIASELESGQKHKIYGDLRVNKLGHIKHVREFVKK
jgi:hypothetical protein